MTEQDYKSIALAKGLLKECGHLHFHSKEHLQEWFDATQPEWGIVVSKSIYDTWAWARSKFKEESRVHSIEDEQAEFARSIRWSFAS